ncbi:MAG: methionyl-tRNA formyltransferase [Candidatus Syntrophosphaera sp.]|nr:methionyl-tRNA formyltransferase [Candidatus Syntrophosphaera sp.]
MRYIFAGSSAFGIPALRGLLEIGQPQLVVSQPDKAAGRHLRPQPCPLAEFAASQGLELFQPEDINSPESLDRIRKLDPELIVTASYGGLLKRELRKMPALGAINLHPSLLPLYRGATPIQSSLLNGDAKTGMTIFKLAARLDAGPILAQQEIPIARDDNFSSLHDKLAILGAEMLLDLIGAMRRGVIEPWEQNESLATHTSKLQKNDLQLDWDQPAVQVLNHVRAFSLVPGAFSWLRGSPLKILKALPTEETAQNTPGTIAGIVRNTGFKVNCRDLQLLVLQVQPAGKKAMDAWAFQLGARLDEADGFSPDKQTSPQNIKQEE